VPLRSDWTSVGVSKLICGRYFLACCTVVLAFSLECFDFDGGSSVLPTTLVSGFQQNNLLFRLSKTFRVKRSSSETPRAFLIDQQRQPTSLPCIDKLTENEGATVDDMNHPSSALLYTLEYSRNFHRHVARHNGTVVRSFLWLDEAMQHYPTAELLPIASTGGSDVGNTLVAGGGLIESTAYQNPQAIPHQRVLLPKPQRRNRDQVVATFQSVLKWYPAQVETLFERWPALLSYPADLLKERLQFLLAPLPRNQTILEQANLTDDIDWPYIFHHDGFGAGMSLGQVSHALQVLPEPLLLRLDSTTYRANVDMDGAAHQVSQFAISESVIQLYEQTPPLVLQMTIKMLHLWVTGVAHLDVTSLAYLQWFGWEWQACRVFAHAFRCSLTISAEPTGAHRGSSPRRGLPPASLAYLQLRLQVRPWHIRAMLNTHSRLAGYSLEKVKRNLDFLQDRLYLRSSQLQAIILNMPSLLGMRVEALESRLEFWTIKVGLTTEQLREVALQKPALLQYSLEDNLDHKLTFFVEELGLTANSSLHPAPLVRMTCITPELWGRSLDRFLAPLARGVCAKCDNTMTLPEFGQLVVQAPEIMRYNLLKLLAKLDFLRQRLGLSGIDLKSMIQRSPRLLRESISTSLEPKIQLIEQCGFTDSTEALRNNPSLLSIDKETLQRRLQRADSFNSEETLTKALEQASKAARSRRAVWLLSESSDAGVELVFSEVSAAAAHAQTSQSNMYRILRLKLLLNGRKYVYADQSQLAEVSDGVSPRAEEFSSCGLQPQAIINETREAHLTIHAAGSAFPPEDPVRGRMRSGGMAIQVRSWTSAEWRQIGLQLWKGMRLRLLSDSQTVIMGYQFTRPSSPRCSLYACHEALRVATEWITSNAESNATITIVCESNYVLDLLQNTSQLMEWGSAESIADFVYTGPGLLHKANPDILYPLARKVLHLHDKHRAFVQFTGSDMCERSLRLREGAKFAAIRMYDSIR
jgi:mTERF